MGARLVLVDERGEDDVVQLLHDLRRRLDRAEQGLFAAGLGLCCCGCDEWHREGKLRQVAGELVVPTLSHVSALVQRVVSFGIEDPVPDLARMVSRGPHCLPWKDAETVAKRWGLDVEELRAACRRMDR